MKKILLDTNAYTNLLCGDEKILDALSKAAVVNISVIVIGELLSGFKGGAKETYNKKLLQEFLEKPTVSVLDVTIETSEIFAEIKNLLKNSGTPIPINDVWIAAHAMETGSVLVTHDDHFSKIPGIRTYPANLK